MRFLCWCALAGLLFSSSLCAQPGETAGVGILLGKQEENIVIKRILADSAASLNKAIQVGDRIIAVAQNNEAPVKLQGMTIAEAVELIRGPKGKTVRLTIVAAGKDDERARVVSLVRGELKNVLGDGVLPAIGSKAPNIQVTPLTGQKPEQLADFIGNVVVLEFWATGCIPCQKVMADLQSYREKYAGWKNKVVLIAASVDEERETVVKHLKAKGWDKTHNVLVGLEGAKAYHLGGIPTTFIIDQQGTIIAADGAGADHVLDIPKVVNAVLGPT